MSQVKYPFNPQLGSEHVVLQQEPQTGAIYFTTDTRKIYLDIDGERAKIPMGGNVGLFYGDMKLAAPPADGQEEFEFAITDIVGNESGVNMLQPNVDDLILNSDGCFYKVLSSYGEDVDTFLNTKKLTIAGSGGGGGGGSVPGDPDSLAGMIVTRLRSDNGATVLYQSACPISFAVRVTDDLGDPQTGNVGAYDLYIDNVKKASGTVKGCTLNIPNADFQKLDLDEVNPSELNTIDVGQYLPLKQNIVVKISVTSMDGATSTRTINVSTTDMTLKWDYDETTINHYDATHPDMELSWNVNGNIEKTTHIIIDDDYSNPITVTNSRADQSYKLNFKERNLTHGAHKVEMYVTANIGGGEARTPSIFKNIIIVEENSLSTIISVGLFDKELTQYNTIKIPILIYDPMNTGGTAIVTLRENGDVRDTWENVQNLDNTRAWSYTPTISGDITLTVQCSGIEKSLTVKINKLDINIEETTGYAFKFKANEFASNSNVQSWFSNGINATFSDNFDWINGGLKSETAEDGNNRQFVNIKAGSTMTINYPLFKQSARTAGKAVKIIFKATSCRDYDARILTCKRDKQIVSTNEEVEIYLVIDSGTMVSYSESLDIVNGNVSMKNPTSAAFDLTSASSRSTFNDKYIESDGKIYLCKIKKIEGSDADGAEARYYSVFFETGIENTFEGLLMNAQYASFKSRNQTITTQYCEDSYIELELDIAKEDAAGVKNYITFWIDGVPSGYVIYDSSDSFIDNTNQYITIGSDDCDVQIYAIKVYEKGLTDEQHLQNFIADAPGAAEMVARYNRNNILDERNEISPALLAKANPGCHVHVYEIGRMTKTKKDKIKGCSYAQYLNSDQAHLTANNVTIKVQGTSSEKYVVAAANLDSEFTEGFIDANGKAVEGWSMNPNSIPVDFTCTKVNVASCENANNALNQEWYNMFQPYKTVIRCKNPNARDTMEFVNGVLFMQDNNKTYVTSGTYDAKDNNIFGDTVGYISNPYPKFYSLGQMGNSKKNIEVFHDTENPLECCVEVGDNQEPQQWMVSDDYLDSDIDDNAEYYGFRYPDGVENATQGMKDAWRRLVHWMAYSNPQPKYQEHKATNEKEYKVFAFNQKKGEDVPVYVLNEEKTAYSLIDGFDASIDTYYTTTEHIHGYDNLPLEAEEVYTEEDHTLKGYKANPEIQKNYSPMCAGIKTTAYVGTYTRDTYERRMAKMLKECEQYLAMDSIIYHFLFIERHCMIDNVAKNTFWSTEDGLVWNLTKDYDNDTADGNDNNGKFTRTYGMEPLDKLNINTYVFNAHQAVWFNFINGLKEACEQMYQKLENETVKIGNREVKLWNKNDYLWFFNEWQSKIPERCWIADYYRKYHRPYEVYGDSMFNSMMEGGQKKHQRAQYETYQDTYMASKYFGTACSGSYSIIRGNGSGLLGYKLPVTTYSDCYIHAHVGSAKSTQRVKRNEVNYLECPADNINNATVYFYPVSAFSTVGAVDGGQVGAYEPEQISFSGANKLRELVISTVSDNAIPNESLISGFAVGNNKLLEKLYVANLTKYNSNLDLTNCPNLREVDARNSTFTAISIADSAPVESIKLYKPTALNFSNLRNVATLDITDYNRLSILNLNNVDNSPGISSKLLVDRSNFLDNYKLTNVQWEINNSEEINAAAGTIRTLEFLLSRSPIETGKGPELQENCLTGDLDITAEGYNSGSDGALRIYNSYSKAKESYERVIYTSKDAFDNDTRTKFIKDGDDYVEVTEYDTQKEYYIEKLIAEYPNLDIEFKGNNAQLYTVCIYDGDSNVFWKRKAAPGTIIDAEFLKYGPKGSFHSSSLYKSKTAEFEYRFLEQWYIKDDNGNPITINGNNNGLLTSAEPIGIQVNSNIHLYPDFETKTRTYTVIVKSKHPTTGEITTLRSDSHDYGTPLKDVLPTDTVPYADSSNLPLLHVYDFIGYSLVDGSTTPVSENYIVNGDATLWAIFNLVENARTVVHPEWFTANQWTYSEDVDTEFYGRTGVILQPKYEKLKGKITIPAEVEFEGKMQPVIALRGFGGEGTQDSNHEFTHVFMEDGKENKLYLITSEAFINSKNLIYFDFDKCAVRTVGQKAFQGCSNLTNTTFGSQLFYVHAWAFNQALTSSAPTTVFIPSSLRTIKELGFGVLYYPEGSTLEIGSEDNLSMLQFSENDMDPFYQNPGNQFGAVNFYSRHYDAGNDLAMLKLNQACVSGATISIV